MVNNTTRKERFVELLRRGHLFSVDELARVLVYHYDVLHQMCTTPVEGDKVVIDNLMVVINRGDYYPLDIVSPDRDHYRFGCFLPFLLIYNLPLVFMTAQMFKLGGVDAGLYPEFTVLYRFYISDDFLTTQDKLKREVIHSQIVSTAELKAAYAGSGRIYHTSDQVKRIGFSSINEFEAFYKEVER